MKKEYLFGHVYLNFKAKATPTELAAGRPAPIGAHVVKQADGRVIAYTGAPQIIGPYNEDLLPTDLYAGCEARVSGIMFGTEYSGRKFISVRLNNIQKFKDGERIGGGERPDAKSQFDPLMQGANPGAADPFAGFGGGLGGGFGGGARNVI